ncbi:RNA-directed DNA polymerase [Botrimarina mediterranea]|nr:RNA-directed DNA polymerase [Botrimarina mediterranea]
MSDAEAKAFFLKHSSYCNFDLPPYFNCDSILSSVDAELGTLSQRPWAAKDVRNRDTSHLLLSNKDGRFAWRPFEIIHPVLYAHLVQLITEPAAWQSLKRRFARFQSDSRMECWSIPRESSSSGKDKASQIFTWWQGIEQRSLELSLEFDVMAHADISNCYGSIYTHSIAWAVNGRSVAKRNHASSGGNALLGNKIDAAIQDMRRGQTNGIPQGSTLMDFVAEIVLGYADSIISRRIRSLSNSVHILRYRDDYRIFAHDSKTLESVLRYIVEVLAKLGWSLNASKTAISRAVVRDSVKRDKIAWLSQPSGPHSMQKQLLLLHHFALEHPNSGSLTRGMTEMHDMLSKATLREADIHPMVAIATDIAVNNPKIYSLAAAVVSRLICRLPMDRAAHLLERVANRFRTVPNTGYLDIWLQRMAIPLQIDLGSSERLCKAANAEEANPWDSSWITARRLKSVIDNESIVDASVINQLAVEIKPEEVDVFFDY